MRENESEVLRIEVPCDREAPRAVRRAVCEVAALDGVRDDLTLVASELVTNAVRYAGCGKDDLLDVRARVSGDSVRLLVTVPGSGEQQVALSTPEDALADGFGMRVLDRLARRSGRERSGSRRLWTELAL